MASGEGARRRARGKGWARTWEKEVGRSGGWGKWRRGHHASPWAGGGSVAAATRPVDTPPTAGATARGRRRCVAAAARPADGRRRRAVGGRARHAGKGESARPRPAPPNALRSAAAPPPTGGTRRRVGGVGGAGAPMAAAAARRARGEGAGGHAAAAVGRAAGRPRRGGQRALRARAASVRRAGARPSVSLWGGAVSTGSPQNTVLAPTEPRPPLAIR